MGRNTKEFSSLPTSTMRNKVWTRVVKAKLLPNSDPYKPLSHKINDAINELSENLGGRGFGNSFVAVSRWMNWWQGGHPSPGKILVIEKLINRSDRWFISRIALADEHPLITVLHAADLLGNPSNKDVLAFSILISMQKKWGAKLKKREDFGYDGWYCPQVPDFRLPEKVGTEHYSVLAPASIIRHMLWLRYVFLDFDETQKSNWSLDLLSAVLSVFTLYNIHGANSMLLSGLDGDAAGLIHYLFFKVGKNVDLSVGSVRKEMFKNIQARLKFTSGLPNDDNFIELLIEGFLLVDVQLKLHGLLLVEICNLDPKLYISETVSC
jgi:hypothetical protein